MLLRYSSGTLAVVYIVQRQYRYVRLPFNCYRCRWIILRPHETSAGDKYFSCSLCYSRTSIISAALFWLGIGLPILHPDVMMQAIWEHARTCFQRVQTRRVTVADLQGGRDAPPPWATDRRRHCTADKWQRYCIMGDQHQSNEISSSCCHLHFWPC